MLINWNFKHKITFFFWNKKSIGYNPSGDLSSYAESILFYLTYKFYLINKKNIQKTKILQNSCPLFTFRQ